MNKESHKQSPLEITAEDIKRCHDVLGMNSWQALAEQHIFITGGTGFVGKWLLTTLLDADEALGLNCKVTLLSRDPLAFQKKWPKIAGRVNWITGDVRSFEIKQEYVFDIIIHAATDVVSQASPDDVFSTCIDGTRHILVLAQQCKAKQFLLVSSGAVYGPLPAGMTHVPESHLGGPDPLLSTSAYGEGKRVSEWLTSRSARDGLEVKIARIFAVVGPLLPMDKHFAIGNFLKAALEKREIVIHGDGTPHRSYLYAADMAAWIWAILFRGRCGRAYNVGSDESISIVDLARRICELLAYSNKISVTQSPKIKGNESHYVPNIKRAQEELNLPLPMSLNEGILRTARANSNHQQLQ